MLTRRSLFAVAAALLIAPKIAPAARKPHVCVFERDPVAFQLRCSCGKVRALDAYGAHNIGGKTEAWAIDSGGVFYDGIPLIADENVPHGYGIVFVNAPRSL